MHYHLKEAYLVNCEYQCHTHILLVSVFWGSGVIGGIQGKQMLQF